jgi:predicted hydrocarbon binding protein
VFPENDDRPHVSARRHGEFTSFAGDLRMCGISSRHSTCAIRKQSSEHFAQKAKASCPCAQGRGLHSPMTLDTVPTLSKKMSSSLTPVQLENALTVVRPTLGTDAPVALYRLVRLVAFEEILGRGSNGTAYLAGKRMGQSLGLPDLESFLKLCHDLKIGRIEVSGSPDSELKVDVHECVTCSGLTPVGRTLCAFEGGLIAGVVQGVTGKRTTAKEVSCIGGLGHNTCGFEVQIGI